MSSDTAAAELTLEVVVDDDTIMVATHGPHRKGDTLCLGATCCDQGDVIRVTVDERGAWAVRLARADAAVLDQAMAGLLDWGGCIACGARRAIMQAVTAVTPPRPTNRQISIHAAIDALAAYMPGHECDKEAP